MQTLSTRHLLLLPALLSTCACFQGERTIRVNPDGSGTIVDSIVIGAQLLAMAKTPPASQATDPKKLQAAADAMGPGVTFVKEERSSNGIKTTVAFKDISVLKVDPYPGPPSDDQSSGQKAQPLTFHFARSGDRSTVTVVQPRPKAASTSPAPALAGGEALAQGMWTMMRGFMKGLKLKTTLEVAGRITHTNSRFAEGPAVILLEMDFDQITADDATFNAFTKAGADPSELDTKKLQGLKGVKVNPDPEVVVEFTSK